MLASFFAPLVVGKRYVFSLFFLFIVALQLSKSRGGVPFFFSSPLFFFMCLTCSVLFVKMSV